MAPELLVGAPPSVRGDLYAAGVVLQACLTGVTPYDGDTPVAFFARKLDTPPRPTPATPRAAGWPAGWPAGRPADRGVAADDTLAVAAQLAARLAAPDPAQRPASAREAYALFARLG
jgi:serine/threonine-protein kinase